MIIGWHDGRLAPVPFEEIREMKVVHEPARDVPVVEETDVLVAGAGVAGCAAAVSAARAGARTVLLERNGCLGGVATATGMANIGNLMMTADHSVVVKGFAADLIERMIAQGGASRHWPHADVPGCVIDSERLKLVLIEMLEEAGVLTLTHAVAARPVAEDSSVRGAFIESKSGRQAVLAKATVDATGEADLAAQAGAQMRWNGGSASTLFKIGNVDLDRFVDFLLHDPDGFPSRADFVRDAATFGVNWRQRGILFFPHGGGGGWRWLKERGDFQKDIPPAWHLDALGMYAPAGSDTVVINSNFYRIEDLDIRNLSRFELHAQKMCYVVGEYLVKNVPGFERGHIVSIGVDLGVRTSRVIVGRATITQESLYRSDESTHVDDAIGCQPTFRKDWATGTCRGAATSDIPFGVTVPSGPANLLVGSGKSVSAKPAGVLRSMAGCMTCGQAAGVASALAAARGIPSADVPIRDLQRELLRQGVWLGDAARLKSLCL